MRSLFLQKCLLSISFLPFTSTLLMASAIPTELNISETPSESSFPIVQKNGDSAGIWTDSSDAKVVHIATQLLAEDIQRVTDAHPTVHSLKKNALIKGEDFSIIVGTIGHNQLIDQLITNQKIDVSKIKNQWESFQILIVDTPFPGIKKSVIIVGSDRRGTAFGVFTLSKAMGVSPWYWWADVTPAHKKQLHLTTSIFRQGPPSVKYRGLFINDEAMGPESLHLWAKETFEPEEGRLGPKSYAKVFELLLRLKANYCWPAMHGPSKAFNMNPKNAQTADDYAIVMGSSHCEQMLRNNITEWKEDTMGPWNYQTNRDRIYKYWEERVESNKAYENSYTVGLRGRHDTEMEGAKGIQDMVNITQQALDDQREILSKHVNPDPTQVPQVLCTYKEVLEVYQHGLHVPDDITLLWADDNHGYTRQLCTPEEQKRSGGSGIYYHLSLLGTPDGFLWLSTISPSLISYELSKAYAYGADRLWVINVGDIKPAEKELTFAMELAWNIHRWPPEKSAQFIRNWAAETFGEETADDIADAMQTFYLLAASGKPEHIYRLEFTPKEIEHRLTSYRQLDTKAREIATHIPHRLQTAYDHLILYPIQGAHWQNEHMLLARRSFLKAAQGDSQGALKDAARSKACTKKLDQITQRYNNDGEKGKWHKIMSWWPRFHRVTPKVATQDLLNEIPHASQTVRFNLQKAQISPEIIRHKQTLASGKDGGKISLTVNSPNSGINYLWVRTTLPTFHKSAYVKYPLPIPEMTGNFNGKPWKSKLIANGNLWHASATAPTWCQLAKVHVKKGENQLVIQMKSPDFLISDIRLSIVQPFPTEHLQVIPASSFSQIGKGKKSKIVTIQGLGTGQGVCCMPFTTPSLSHQQFAEAPWVEYVIDVPSKSDSLEIRTLPNQRIHEGRGVRYAVAINGKPPRFFDVQADEFTPEWQHNVIHGYTSRSLNLSPYQNQTITVRIYLLDPGLVMRELLINPAPPTS
jgi:hypothetical protein